MNRDQRYREAHRDQRNAYMRAYHKRKREEARRTSTRRINRVWRTLLRLVKEN